MWGRWLKKQIFFLLFLNIGQMGLFSFSFSLNFAFASEFQKLWVQEIAQPESTLTPEVRTILARRHVIFIGGLFNEFGLPGWLYFRDTLSAAERELGMSATFYGPNSFSCLSDSIEALYLFIQNESARVRKPILLETHSMGSEIAFHLLLKYPHLILDGVVECLISVQGAIRGSSLLDPRSASPFAQLMHFVMGSELKRLGTQGALENLQLAFQDLNRAIQIEPENGKQIWTALDQHILFYKSSMPKESLNFFLMMTQLFFGQDIGLQCENDGFICIQDQYTDLMGQDRGTFEGGHSDVFGPEPIGLLWPSTRRAFQRALFQDSYGYLLRKNLTVGKTR